MNNNNTNYVYFNTYTCVQLQGVSKKRFAKLNGRAHKHPNIFICCYLVRQELKINIFNSRTHLSQKNMFEQETVFLTLHVQQKPYLIQTTDPSPSSTNPYHHNKS